MAFSITNKVQYIGQPSESPPAKASTLCDKCFAPIGRGKPHSCQKAHKDTNISKLVQTTSEKTQAKVASTTLHKIAAEAGVSARGGTLTLPSGSKQLPVTVGTPKTGHKEVKFSHEDMMRLQSSQNLSDRGLM